jgi:NTP pyrophosphatase (non-canonical NTP hydrolase)
MSQFNNIRQWASDRNLILGSEPRDQMLKLAEEVGELAGAIARKKDDAIMDGLGDAVVVLTILAAQCGFHLEDCISAAWEEIKDRKGRMVDGIYIKEADL